MAENLENQNTVELQRRITLPDAIWAAANDEFYMAVHNEGRSEDRLAAATTKVCRSIELQQTPWMGGT